MIDVLYFARVREVLGIDREQLEVDGQISDVSGVIDLLCARGENWQEVLRQENLLIAVNQVMAKPNQTVTDGDEIAFFPPVSGG